jgi:hypothetical protein
MSDTPRTDEIARGNHVVPVEFAEDLEREIMNLVRLCDHLASCSKRSLKWRCADEDLPDDDQTVLLHLQGGEVWTGFREAGEWRFVSADLISEPVLHWAPFPEPPEL